VKTFLLILIILASCTTQDQLTTIKQAKTTNCINDCLPEQTRCTGNSYQVCTNTDFDSCSEWSQTQPCKEGQSCKNGKCEGIPTEQKQPTTEKTTQPIQKEQPKTVQPTTPPAQTIPPVQTTTPSQTKQLAQAIIGSACQKGQTCDDNNPNTIDTCYAQTCVYFPKTCEHLQGDQNPRNVKFAIIPQEFTSLSSETMQKINQHVEKILNTEPFKTHANEMDFYLFNTNFQFITPNTVTSTDNLRNVLDIVKSSCNADEIIIILNREYQDGLGPQHVAITTINDLVATIHELGHSFGGLGDTYLGWTLFDGNTPYEEGSLSRETGTQNTDIAGCPKWCQSNTGTYQTACTQITDEQTCRTYERELYTGPEGTHWACTAEKKCCVWLPETHTFFNSKCVSVRDNTNIGVGCYGNSGCYYGGIRGTPIWRSEVDTIGLMGEGMRISKDFSDVEKRGIENVFACCYPQNCQNYPAAQCQTFASTYSRFTHCNTCT